VPPDLVASRCFCPSGSAVAGSANTAVGSGKDAVAHGGANNLNNKNPRGCTPCAVNAYAPKPKPVAAAKCSPCPKGTTTNGATGSATCFVPLGSFFYTAKGQTVTCPVNFFCAGGDFANVGKVQTACPTGSTTAGKTGSVDLAACIAPPGKYYDGKSAVVVCPNNSYCTGGSATGAGKSSTPCPAGATTASAGASAIDQCQVPPGSWYNSGSSGVALCAAGFYCQGGSVTGTGAQQQPCPAGTTSSDATSALSQVRDGGKGALDLCALRLLAGFCCRPTISRSLFL